MISHKYRCIYIHIPKTAGTSVEKRFGAHEVMDARLKQDHRTVRNLIDGISPFSTGAIGFRNILAYINQRYKGVRDGVDFVSRDQFDSYFKFCFVRNPWDRVYSWYRNVARDTQHQLELGIHKNVTFSDFVTLHMDQWALRPQIDWIVDKKGNVSIDFIGKFENLSKDFEVICEHLGIEDTSLPMMLDSGKESYVDAYDDKIRDLVGSRYCKEIEMFNYKFGE